MPARRVEIGPECVTRLRRLGVQGMPGRFLMTTRPFEAPFRDEDLPWEHTLPIAPYEGRPITQIGNNVRIGTHVWLKDASPAAAARRRGRERDA